MWTISVPLFVQVSKAKRFYLNLNGYRNEHYQTLNKAKVLYAAIVKPLLDSIPRNLGAIHLHYTLYPRTKAMLDTNNVLCIVDKFFCDTLVTEKVIKDDNHTIVLTTRFSYGGVDPVNPRAEVTITLDQPGDMTVTTTTQDPEREHMKITINQAEIEAAIIASVTSTMSVNEGHEISVDLRATRGEGGYSAEIDISPVGSVKPAPTPAKAASTAAPVSTAAAVNTDLNSGTLAADPATEVQTPAAEAPGEAAQEAEEAPASTGKPSLFGQ